jgi:hypothetical protein
MPADATRFRWQMLRVRRSTGASNFDAVANRGGLFRDAGELLQLLRRIDPRPRFIGVVQEGEQSIVFGVCEWIEFMRMALSAAGW